MAGDLVEVEPDHRSVRAVSRGPVCGSADWLVAGEFGDGLFRTLIVDQGFTRGGGGE